EALEADLHVARVAQVRVVHRDGAGRLVTGVERVQRIEIDRQLARAVRPISDRGVPAHERLVLGIGSALELAHQRPAELVRRGAVGWPASMYTAGESASVIGPQAALLASRALGRCAVMSRTRSRSPRTRPLTACETSRVTR